MFDAIAIATFMSTTDRLAAAYTLRSRAIQWAIACEGTTSILAAYEVVQWATRHHAGECG